MLPKKTTAAYPVRLRTGYQYRSLTLLSRLYSNPYSVPSLLDQRHGGLDQCE